MIVLALTMASAPASSAQGAPAGFVPNLGQWPQGDRFVWCAGDVAVRAADGGLWLQFHERTGDGEGQARVSLIGLGLGELAEPVAEGPLTGRHHVLHGNDQERWVRDAQSIGVLRWPDVAPGIDVTVRPGTQSLSFVWEVEAGYSLAGAPLLQAATLEHELQEDGSLVVRRGGEERFRLSAPVIRSVSPTDGGDVTDAAARWEVLAPGRITIQTDTASSVPLEIETGLLWSTWLGGATKGSTPDEVAMGPAGEVATAGRTYATDFPVTPGAFDEEFTTLPTFVWTDAYIALFEPSGALRYATYLGGQSSEHPKGIGFATDGTLVVGGRTTSLDFPVTDGSSIQSFDGFLTRFNPEGSGLVISTHVGASGPEHIDDLEFVGDRVIIGGSTNSPDFPTTLPGNHVATPGQFNSDGFLMCVDTSTFEMHWSLLIGGTGDEFGALVGANEAGDVVVRLSTVGDDFPVTANALATGPWGQGVCVFRNHGQDLVFSSYFLWGKSMTGVAIDGNGRPVLAGFAVDDNIPVTPGVFQTVPFDTSEGYVVILDPILGSFHIATYFGGPGADGPRDVVIDGSGVITLSGTTEGGNYPVTPGAAQTVKGDVWFSDAFVVRFDPRLQRLLYGTYIGGNGYESIVGSALAVGPDGSAALTMESQSSDFPVTPGAFQQEPGLLGNATVTALSMLPQGVGRYGRWTSADGKSIPLGVGSWPAVGQADFVLTCSGGPSFGTQGMLLLSLGAFAESLTVNGAGLWVDPASLVRIGGIPSDAQGFSLVPLAIPADADLEGLTVYAQVLWPGFGAAGGLAASNALAITVQPGN